MITLLDPRSGPVVGRVNRAGRLPTLAGKTAGILWNGRSYGGDLLDRIAALLKARHGVELVLSLKKAYIGNVAPPAYFDEFVAKKVDLALVGLGD